MTSSFYTALSGLQAHQSWIDVIGNNLANSNTPGYKTGTATFSDQFSQTLQFAQGPGSNFGGRNPVQVGHGVRLSDIGHAFTQGALTSTGRPFDLALEGEGFFALKNGAKTLYSRVGSFGLDASKNLVDQRTGFKVLDSTGGTVSIDTDALFPPKPTTTVSVAGNLPANITGPLAEVLTAVSGFKQGVPASVTGSTTGPFTIPTGETWTLSVIANGGLPQQASVTSTTGTVTAAQIASAIDALQDVNASVDGSGHVVVASDRTGANISLKVLSGTTGMDLAQAAGLPTVLVQGTETPLTSGTGLNELPANTIDYADGDTIRIAGVDADGSAINATFTYGASNDGTKVSDLVSFLDGVYTKSTVNLDAQGRIVVQADTPGEANLLLSITNGSGSTGSTQWGNYALGVTTNGTKPDEVSTTSEVFDPAGLAHTISFTFQRQPDGSWTATPELPSNEGTIISTPITGIRFGPDGTPIGLGGVDTTVSVQFTGQPSTQTFQLQLGSDASFTGITQFGAGGEVVVRDQDGYGVGSLSSISVSIEGNIEGSYTNGQKQAVGTIGIATFSNPEGLYQVSDNTYAASANSGDPVLAPANLGRAGRVVGGSLENSNVDTAEQFVMLIEAQRGFQANSRVISAQDEVLKELVNLI
jgi:flagellar hook protein FlgE